jgi:hypothetical protein
MYLTDLDLDILKKLGPFKCNDNIYFYYTEKIDLHNLVSCRGYIDADSATTVNLSNLVICDYITADSATTVDLPKLESCRGSIGASSATTVNLPKLERCSDINAYSATTVDLPKLERCSDINAYSATTLNLPKLESCRGRIDASSATTLNLPKLVICNWDIYAYSATTLNLPKLVGCGTIYVGSNTKKIIIPENLKSKLNYVPYDCEIIHPQTEPKLESFKQYFFRICN